MKEIIKKILASNQITRKIHRSYVKNKIIKKQLTDVVIYANSFCNAKCTFCDVVRVDEETQHALGIARPILGAPNYMTTELFNKIINDELINDGNKKLFVFLMTEPLLSKNIGEMLELTKKHNHETKITTNGFLLKKRSQSIYPHLDMLGVSIDGTKKTHDKIRGKNFFDKAIEGLIEMRKLSKDLYIEVNVTISSLNYLDMFNLVLAIDSLGIRIDEMRFQSLDTVTPYMANEHNTSLPWLAQDITGDGESDFFTEMDLDLLFQELEKIKNYKPKNIVVKTMKPSLDTLDDVKKYFHFKGEKFKNNDMCGLPYRNLAVNTSGNVYWHMRCYNNYILGNINKNTLTEIWNGQKANYFREEFEKYDLSFPACTRCCGLMSTDKLI